MRKSVEQAPTAGEQTQQKPCRTSSDVGAELENHTIGRGPMYDRKGLNPLQVINYLYFLGARYICFGAVSAPFSGPQGQKMFSVTISRYLNKNINTIVFVRSN
jgi:hypothetical protein